MTMNPAPFGQMVTAMITPMTSDGTVDYDGAARLAQECAELFWRVLKRCKFRQRRRRKDCRRQRRESDRTVFGQRRHHCSGCEAGTSRQVPHYERRHAREAVGNVVPRVFTTVLLSRHTKYIS